MQPKPFFLSLFGRSLWVIAGVGTAIYVHVKHKPNKLLWIAGGAAAGYAIGKIIVAQVNAEIFK